MTLRTVEQPLRNTAEPELDDSVFITEIHREIIFKFKSVRHARPRPGAAEYTAALSKGHMSSRVAVGVHRRGWGGRAPHFGQTRGGQDIF